MVCVDGLAGRALGELFCLLLKNLNVHSNAMVEFSPLVANYFGFDVRASVCSLVSSLWPLQRRYKPCLRKANSDNPQENPSLALQSYHCLENTRLKSQTPGRRTLSAPSSIHERIIYLVNWSLAHKQNLSAYRVPTLLYISWILAFRWQAENQILIKSWRKRLFLKLHN